MTLPANHSSGDDPGRAGEFLGVMYGELRRLAHRRMAKEAHDLTLQPTALLHEAYLRVVAGGKDGFQNEAHFFAAVAEAMRRILVERARRRDRVRHGAGRHRESLEQCDVPSPSHADAPEDIVAIDAALSTLEGLDPRMAEVVKLRYFAGLTCEETAAALDLAPRTVYRQWNAARAWLKVQLEQTPHEP